MLARLLLIGVMALATLPDSSRPQMLQPGERVLLVPAPLSDEITALWVVEHHSDATSSRQPYLEVRLYGQSVHQGETRPKLLSGMGIQAWLLRKDGTAVAQGWKPESVSLITVDFITDQMSFGFALIPPQELAGVVVSVNGRLYVREISASAEPPTLDLASWLSSVDPIVKVTPTLPGAAKSAGVTGPVILEITVDQSGNVTVGRVLHGDPLLNAAAEDAVRQWKYRPVLVGGRPASVVFSVAVAFKDH